MEFKAKTKHAGAARRTISSRLSPIAPSNRKQQAQIQNILRSTGVQAKLTIGQPNDKYEQEADRVADQVMRMSDADLVLRVESGTVQPIQIQRLSSEPESEVTQRQPEEEDEKLQAKEIPGQTPTVAPNLESRIDSLKGGGQQLDSTTRLFFEPRFGHDFSNVRVHSDSNASETAKSINARAFTHDNHVVMGAGEYQPKSQSGQRLLGHELAHVIQQGEGRTSSNVQLQGPNESDPIGTAMGRIQQGQSQPATVVDRHEFALDAVHFLERQGDFFAHEPDRDTAEVLGLLRTTANSALTIIANDASLGSTANRVRTTYSAAVHTVLVSRTVAQPNSVRTAPTLQQLYERNRDNILPFALPQAEVDTGSNELSDELSTALPEEPTRTQRTRHAAIRAARQRLRVITSQVNIPINDLFSTQGGTTTIPLPANTTARFSSTIPTTLHRGLQSLGAQLHGTPLTANSTVILALNLTPFGGSHAAYRFTRLDLGALGTEILIERQGTIGIEGLTTEQRTALRERFDRVGFSRGRGFNQDEFDQVLIGLGEISEAHLSQLGALRFEQTSSDPEHAAAAAHYDQSAHTVRVFDRAYSSSGLTRMGRAGRTLGFAAHAVEHEVGHALDLSSLRTTAAETSAAQSALLAEFGTGGTGYEIPNRSDPRRKRYDELNADITSANAAERSVRSRSGARWATGNPSVVSDALVAHARQPAFRQAALRDGGRTRRMPTDYPNPDSVWQEYFADSFSLYQSSPDLLQRIRPNVYNYMTQQFPR